MHAPLAMAAVVFWAILVISLVGVGAFLIAYKFGKKKAAATAAPIASAEQHLSSAAGAVRDAAKKVEKRL